MIWIRARVDTVCGNCRAAIKRDAVMAEVRIADSRRSRCEACGRFYIGEGPIPDPPHVPPKPPKPPRQPRQVASVPRPAMLPMETTRRPEFVPQRASLPLRALAAKYGDDFKARQSGEREPGEDDAA